MKGIEKYAKEPCTMTEGGDKYIRLFFSSPLDIEVLGDYIFGEYQSMRKSASEYFNYNSNNLIEYKNGSIMNNALTTEDVEKILLTIHSKSYQTQTIVEAEEVIDREKIQIHPINNRVPLVEIQNLNDWDKGFDKGFPFWEKGEELRKAGDFERTIEFYDNARLFGYIQNVFQQFFFRNLLMIERSSPS